MEMVVATPPVVVGLSPARREVLVLVVRGLVEEEVSVEESDEVEVDLEVEVEVDVLVLVLVVEPEDGGVLFPPPGTLVTSSAPHSSSDISLGQQTNSVQ